MAEEKKISSLRYAAALLKRMISPLSPGDPDAADLARLSGPMLGLAFAVAAEGRDKGQRLKRLNVETAARGLDPLLVEFEAADPRTDLAALQVSSGWDLVDLADIVKEELPPVRWVVKPYISRPSVNLFFGRPKALKSLLLLDLCMHVAGGHPWLTDPSGSGGFEVTAGKILWVDLENGSLTLRRRMKAFARPLGMGENRDEFLAYSMPRPFPNLSQGQDVDAMISRIQGITNVSILLIDHLAQVLGEVDENSSLVGSVMGNLRLISEACDTAVILIHHSRKGLAKDSGDPADALRGSGAIVAAVDGAYLIERDKIHRDELKLGPVAVRGAEVPIVGARFSFEQDKNGDLAEARFWRQEFKPDSVKAQEAVLQVLRQGQKNQTALRSAVEQLELGLSDAKIRDAITRLESSRDIVFEQGGKGAHLYRLAGEDEDDEQD